MSAAVPTLLGTSHPGWGRAEAFYRQEALLLQDRRYRDWLALMDPAISYRVPVGTATAAGLVFEEDTLGYYDEDHQLLEARVAKLESKQSWVEQPPSRLRYFVSVLAVEEAAEGALLVRANLLLLQARWNLDQTFSGERRDELVPHGDGLRLRRRRVMLDRQVVGNQGLSVFF